MKNQDELNKLLREEVKSKNPNEVRIRELVEQGADINNTDNNESLLIEALWNFQHTSNFKLISLLIEFGADLSYTEEGFNCLFDACLTWNPKLVEMLLKAGASPNCISSDDMESLLDWAEFDQWFEEIENRGGGEPMAEIVKLLKQFGAKHTDELYAEKPENFLYILTGQKKTLFTAKGNLKIEDIPNIDNELVNSYKKWVFTNPDIWKEYKYDEQQKIINIPDISKLEEHNKDGLLIAKKLKVLVGPDIKVKYYSVKTEDLKKSRVRNVESIEIK